jgi:hypothetical protein
MTGNTPMSGRDTAAAFRGLVIGFVAIAVIVLAIVYLTNQKFAGHEPATTAQPH